ncbi:MAG: alpha/beta fold hydrolase [Planctomycetes bacterium]|nr:alpha/beta fold hydrolase [Planctomycetota bacterium]
MSAAFTVEGDVCVLALPGDFALEGGSLPAAQLAYECQGNPDGPLVCVLGGISSGRHIASSPSNPRAGYWEWLVGAERPLDTRTSLVVGIDWIGGAGLSSGPASSGLGWSFPAVSTRDQARALHELLPLLGRTRFDTLVGASFGGMVALAFAELFPEAVGKLVVISAAAASDPLASAWRSLQASILELGRASGQEERALALARGLALTTYRAREDWERRGGPAGVRSYLEARGAEFVRRFDAPSLALLSRATDAHVCDPGAIHTAASVAGADSDLLVPWTSVEALARGLGGPVELHRIVSAYGHDAFLKEEAQVGAIVRAGGVA